MGCDIHAYIDYDDFETKDGEMWVSCFAPNVDFGRNYTLFTLMAGVRYDERTDQYKPLFEPRGIPENCSFLVTREYTLYITDNEEHATWDDYCSREKANKWIRNGYSKKVSDNRVSHPDWHSASYLTVEELEQVKEAYENIEFAERSWFQMRPPEEQPIPANATATELDCQYSYGKEWFVEVGEKKTYPVSVTFDAIIAVMKTLNGDNPKRSRLVFWFDN